MIKTQKETSYCYYSNFNLYDNTQLIIRREKFIKSLIQSLGEEWRIYATQAIMILIETQVRHLPWQFCFDNLLFAWLDNEDIVQEDFMTAALNRIRPYNVDPIYFKPVCDGFYYTSQQLWVKMRLSRPSSTENIKSVEQIKSEEVRNITQFLKPLVRVSEKIRAYFKSEQEEPHSTKMEIEEPVKEVRTLKQIDKIDESSLSMEMVDSAYQYVSQFFTRSYANIQVAKQFIVNIIEIKQEVLQNFSNNPIDPELKIRVIQPSQIIYDNLLSLWALWQLSYQQHQFNDFVGRAQALLGDYWNDQFTQSIELFFNLINNIQSQILLDATIRQEDYVQICGSQSARFESDWLKYGICKQSNSNTNDFYILMELMEKWKTELFQDQALNRLFDNSISQEDFVLMILQKYNMVQLGEIFSRLTSINQSVSSQLSEHVKNNYQLLISNLSKNSNEQHQVIVAKMAFIKQLQTQTNSIFQEKIQQIEQLEPEIKRNKTLLNLCEQLKKFQQQIKILNSLIQLTPTINVIDPFRVSHVLFEIKQMNLSGFKLYQNQVKLLNQVEEAVITKASKKFSDAFTNKSLPELSSCLAIFYNLNRLHQTVESKVNSILKSIAESYKLLFQKTPSISDWRAAIKEDFNYVLQVWLLWQAIQQRDPFQFVHYEELLKDKFPNIFKQFWDKYCDIIEQSLALQQCLVHVNYPQILDQYVEFMQNFHDSILVFPGAILMNVRIIDYFQDLLEVVHALEVNYRIHFQQFLQEQFQLIYQGLNEKKLNIVILSVGSIIDFIKSDVETIKDPSCFKFATSKIVSQLVALQQQYATENQNILNYCVLRMLSFHDTPMNHHLDVKQLEVLTIQKIDNPLLDVFFQSEAKLRKQNIESLINQLQKQ